MYQYHNKTSKTTITMKTLISRLTMKWVSYNFFDKVEGREVHNYVDKYGQKWMANYPFFVWSFRIKK